MNSGLNHFVFSTFVFTNCNFAALLRIEQINLTFFLQSNGDFLEMPLCHRQISRLGVMIRQNHYWHSNCLFMEGELLRAAVERVLSGFSYHHYLGLRLWPQPPETCRSQVCSLPATLCELNITTCLVCKILVINQ